MPTDTFMKLPEEKQEKIIMAGKKEFARVQFEQTSIKNIVEDAGIARGSFYQYFESKEDLLSFIMNKQIQNMDEKMREMFIQKNGDIFEVLIEMYDFMVNNIFTQTDCDFHKRIFENIRTSQDIFMPRMSHLEEPFFKETIYELVDKSKLETQNDDDLRTIIKMLLLITRKALVSNFKYTSKKQAREDYLKQINYLKYGVLKKEGKTC